MDIVTESLLAYIGADITAPTSRFPTAGLVFWHPLDQWRTKAATGQKMTYNGTAATPVMPTATTYNGIPCCLFGPDSYWYSSTPVKEIMKACLGTLSCWVASATTLVKWQGSDGIVCVRVNQTNLQRFGVEWQNDKPNLSAGKHNSSATYNTYTSVPNDVKWHHYAVELECQAGWEATSWKDRVYIDGVKVRANSNNYSNYGLAALCIGQKRASGSYGFYIAGVRLYNRILSDDEIAALYAEYTPTT